MTEESYFDTQNKIPFTKQSFETQFRQKKSTEQQWIQEKGTGFFRAIPLLHDHDFKSIDTALQTIYCMWRKQHAPLISMSYSKLEIGAFRRLDELPVVWGCHFLLQLSQYVLHGVLPLPICKQPKFLRLNLQSAVVFRSFYVNAQISSNPHIECVTSRLLCRIQEFRGSQKWYNIQSTLGKRKAKANPFLEQEQVMAIWSHDHASLMDMDLDNAARSHNQALIEATTFHKHRSVGSITTPVSWLTHVMLMREWKRTLGGFSG